MESDIGKLFVGGLSWETNEDSLREYFENFGEVLEILIIKERTTGRGRGFGFVTFADPDVVEGVVMHRHPIDGRLVEAKKALPRDDQRILLNRKNNSFHDSAGSSRTKKIFVGGLPSSITKEEFNKYFENFGVITDVVVMYDHNTRRPRGFGFITFNSEDAVDRVLCNTFHELNGKMVEVKRAIPKELVPGPTMRPPVGRHNYGLNRVNNFLNEYRQPYNSSSLGNYDIKILKTRFGTMFGGRDEPPFTPSYENGLSFEHGVSPSYDENLTLNSNNGYGQALSTYYSENATRFTVPIGHTAGSNNHGLSVSSTARNIWNNRDIDFNIFPASANSFEASGIGRTASFNNNNISLQGLSSSPTTHAMSSGSRFISRNDSYEIGDNTFGLSSDSYARSNNIGCLNISLTTRNNMDSIGSDSIYRDPTWYSALNEHDGSSSFDYGLDATTSDVTAIHRRHNFRCHYHTSTSQLQM